MGKISLNFVLLLTLVLVALYAWRSKRRRAWVHARRCYACGGPPSANGKAGGICTDCLQTRTIQRWLIGFIVLVAAGIAAWLRWPS